MSNTALALTLCLGRAATLAALDAPTAFDRLRGLEGSWVGETEEGSMAHKDYRLVANGTALVEEYDVEGRDDRHMLTVYHLDGDRLLLTHYCVAGNQPRMAADLSGSATDRLAFELVDATGLEHPGEGHMHSARFRFLPDGTMEQEWVFVEEGRDAYHARATFRRRD
jgi:hypothetical protein